MNELIYSKGVLKMKVFKKSLSIILAILTIFSCLSVSVISVSAANLNNTAPTLSEAKQEIKMLKSEITSLKTNNGKITIKYKVGKSGKSISMNAVDAWATECKYQIQCAKSSSFKDAINYYSKNTTLTKPGNVGAKHYFRVRLYVKYKGQKLYSSWSPWRYITCRI